MKQGQKTIKIIIVVAMLLLVVLFVFFLMYMNRDKQKKKNVPTPSAVQPTETPIPTSAPVTTPTLDVTLSDEDKALQVILNQGIHKKADLKYIQKTEDGLFKFQNMKESSSNRVTYYLVNIHTQTYEVLSELAGAGSDS